MFLRASSFKEGYRITVQDSGPHPIDSMVTGGYTKYYNLLNKFIALSATETSINR